MKLEDIEIGMVVRLASGGPAMTVNCTEARHADGVLGTFRIQCVYFQKDKEYATLALFRPETLTKFPGKVTD